MSDRTEFDDLARRKLESLEPQFAEADWTAAKLLINAEQRGRSRYGWIAAVVLLIGSGTWYLMKDHGAPVTKVMQPAEPAATEIENASLRTTTLSKNNTSEIGSADQSAYTERTTGTFAMDERSTIVQHDEDTPKHEASATLANAPTRAKHLQELTELAKSELEGLPVVDPSADPSSTVKAQSSSIFNVEVRTEDTSTPSVTGGAQPDIHSTPEVKEEHLIYFTTTDIPEGQDIEPSTNLNSTVSSPATPKVGDMSPHVVVQEGTTRTISLEEQNNDLFGVTPEVFLDKDRRETQLNPASDTLLSEPAAVHEKATSLPQDSALATPLLSPLPVTPASPWEISILAGMLRSSSTYSGGSSDQWSSDIQHQWAGAFGAEVMHMGRNFGIGGGVHFSTYQETLNVEERNLTTVVIRDSNYFQPIDTTILYVIGNVVIDGQDWYVTESVDTTINILVPGTHSFNSSRILLEAMKTVTRLSYAELPILFDAHIVQGPWALGVRGGPTVGVVTGRRGVVPNAAFDDYTPFTTEQFRTPVFGITARGYVRYRLTPGWTIGIEPTWRGHLDNAFSSGDLVRKNSGVGGMFSVTYRLK